MNIDRLKDGLADRYRIERELGSGGMATVHLAEDLRHRRKVAIKVMRPELAASLGAERFLREVEIAARLSHPHILPVFDSGEADGFLFYVTPYVEGETLAVRLKRDGALPVVEALRLAREVAEALSYAHARGFVHRDIKPANILLQAGHALVADFGIARAVSDGGQALTQTGLAIGTPQYMSPEQATASSDVDGRSDIYSLGCVLYEMIAGEPPYSGPTAHAVLARALTEPARPLEQTRPSVPPQVGAVVMKAMSRTPADRYVTGEEFAAAITSAEDIARAPSGAVAAAGSGRGLRPWQLAAGAVLVMAAGAAGMKVLGGNTGGTDSSGARSVAVLPFENLGSAEDAYFADGVVYELRDRLGRIAQLTVTASASADQYRGGSKTGPEIARELRVDQVLMGKVRWATGSDGTRQVRVSTELVDGRTGHVTWRDSFDADMANAFEIQGRIATRVAAALGALLAPQEAAGIAGRPTDNPQAYDLYLRGLALPTDGAPGARIRAGLYEQAVALDPKFSRGWAALASSYIRLYTEGARDPEAARRAKEALDRVMELASDSAMPHIVAANYYSDVVYDLAAARQAIRRALELEPKNDRVLTAAASYDLDDGDFQAMFEKLTLAREINPRSPSVLASLIQAQVYHGRLDQAVATGEELNALSPTRYSHIMMMVMAHAAAGDIEGARRVVRETVERVPAPELVAYFSGYHELAYLLPDSIGAMLFRMTPASFDNDRAWWAQALAVAADQQGDLRRARAYADSGVAAARQQVAASPGDPQLRILYAVMLAYLGRNEAALGERDRALAEMPEGYPPYSESYVLAQAARVDLILGQNEQAMDRIEEMVSRPGYYTRQYLKVDPMYRPLHGNPRFERIVAGGITVPVD